MRRRISIISILLFLCMGTKSFSQILNYNNLKKGDKNIAAVYAGVEYGLVAGAAYGYQLQSKLPVIINVEFSIPSGNNLVDDFKTKIGGQASIYHWNNFQVIAKFQGIFRKNENEFVRLLNFGSDISGTLGYFKSGWFVAVEIGFDKAVVTHFKHSNSYKEVYPQVQDGWFDPASGGNFNFGIQAGFSFKKSDIFMKAGKLVTQNFSDPALPYSIIAGYTIRL